MRATRTKRVVAPLLIFSSISLVNAGLARRALAVPTDLTDGWEYVSCYTDVDRTINSANYNDNVNMTAESCIAFCTTKGLGYAGVEYSQECYCGSSLAAAAAEAPEADCNMPCTGDATQPCGGSNRLNLYHSSAVVGPSPNPGVNGYSYLGCYSEGTTGRSLTEGVGSIPGAEMTVAKCTAACKTAGFILAGVEYSGECYCGNKISNGGAVATDGCNMLCNGNQSEYCGGPNRLNVYGTELPTGTDTPSGGATSTSVTVADPTAPAQPPTVGTYSWYGCATEIPNGRVLSGASFAADTMTLENCQAFCADFEYFGVEYARECYCGNSFNPGSVPAPDTDCNFPCAGDASELCGAGNRLSIYSKGGEQPPTGTGTGTDPTPPATTAPGTPQPTGLPDGWSAQGCYIDGADGRILIYQAPDSQTLTPQSCAALCDDKGYIVSGTEYSQQCFCGNSILNGGVKTADSDCSSPCTGDSTQKCGAGDRMSIVSKGTPTVDQPPTAQTGGFNGDWTYQGCVEDNLNDKRTFYWQNFFPGVMTANMCLDRCAKYGYMAAGLEYGEECYCGDAANIETAGATFRPETECNILCAGNTSAYCGGGSRLSTYFWTGTPLYSWDFPQDYRAGRYDFLVNGVTVPLIAQETIQGKVSFLSKWGTGKANETGAYELNLADNSWRALHLKTDVFCSASITLPDKAGRNLNVGGWSGDSTEGVRLYWPDGNHDWEENVSQLSLQVGRWYPSAMVMSNGSIMVIGGETGSNAAAVPSIEVLPYTGTAPLYMDWLDRTDPNNLYPFVAILPKSGGIFVAYWNEARILDPATFATVKTLPNAPGAVNDDLGGRTYPLEGTAVLLPQKAPYTDDLGVLICGGSTVGPANAIDNCVTIFPEAATPKWTLERLPSFRVMPCIAPLPDGTYLIANGAHHGVAGFGLAENPNLNAMLYDPAKPVGSRITVAANTTIARLYHSEAITLLDGRVLISGSDPEDDINPEEYRIEVFMPPYLLSGKPRPSFTVANKDWAHGAAVTVNVVKAGNGAITATLLGSVGSTHGNSMGARTLVPDISCEGNTCTVTAPPNAKVAPPGWYQFFILDGGIPAVGVYVRIGGDPAGLGNWPAASSFSKPGV